MYGYQLCTCKSISLQKDRPGRDDSSNREGGGGGGGGGQQGPKGGVGQEGGTRSYLRCEGP